MLFLKLRCRHDLHNRICGPNPCQTRVLLENNPRASCLTTEGDILVREIFSYKTNEATAFRLVSRANRCGPKKDRASTVARECKRVEKEGMVIIDSADHSPPKYRRDSVIGHYARLIRYEKSIQQLPQAGDWDEDFQENCPDIRDRGNTKRQDGHVRTWQCHPINLQISLDFANWLTKSTTILPVQKSSEFFV